MIKFSYQDELNDLENIKTCLDDEQEDNKFADMFEFNSQLTDRPDDEDTNEGFEFRDIIVKKDKKKKKDERIKEEQSNLLKIIPMKTNKANIKQRELMNLDIIPRHPSAVIFNGKSGSGKTQLMVNLLTRPQFYGRTKPSDPKSGYFDLIFLFSPTAEQDDLVRFLKLPKKRIITGFDTEKLDKILEVQDNLVKDRGVDKAPKILIIFEDIQSEQKFQKTKSFKRCYIQGRHISISTFLLGQSYTRTERMCRLQANNVFFFPSASSEVELISNEYAPPNCSKKEFMNLVKEVTSKQYNFLHINFRCPPNERFRENLDIIVNPK
jgi:hypothetical protein